MLAELITMSPLKALHHCYFLRRNLEKVILNHLLKAFEAGTLVSFETQDKKRRNGTVIGITHVPKLGWQIVVRDDETQIEHLLDKVIDRVKIERLPEHLEALASDEERNPQPESQSA